MRLLFTSLFLLNQKHVHVYLRTWQFLDGSNCVELSLQAARGLDDVWLQHALAAWKGARGAVQSRQSSQGVLFSLKVFS